MLELDVSGITANCCFCHAEFAVGIEEHQEICPVGSDYPPYEKYVAILQSRAQRLSKQRNWILDKLIKNEMIPVRNKLGPDFCIKCTSVEEHERENCLQMTREQAFEALFANHEFKVMSNRVDQYDNLKDCLVTRQVLRRGFARKEKEREFKEIVENLKSERISARSIRMERREQREAMAEFDENTTEKLEWLKNLFEIGRSSALSGARFELLSEYRAMVRLLQREEELNPSGTMMRFVSTYNADAGHDDSFKLVLL